jgi:hypothetical protein
VLFIYLFFFFLKVAVNGKKIHKNLFGAICDIIGENDSGTATICKRPSRSKNAVRLLTL